MPQRLEGDCCQPSHVNVERAAHRVDPPGDDVRRQARFVQLADERVWRGVYGSEHTYRCRVGVVLRQTAPGEIKRFGRDSQVEQNGLYRLQSKTGFVRIRPSKRHLPMYQELARKRERLMMRSRRSPKRSEFSKATTARDNRQFLDSPRLLTERPAVDRHRMASPSNRWSTVSSDWSQGVKASLRLVRTAP